VYNSLFTGQETEDIPVLVVDKFQRVHIQEEDDIVFDI
jgi:hypothetical protein